MNRQNPLLANTRRPTPLLRNKLSTMQYGGNVNPQQQRLLMMMQARQQAAAQAAAAHQQQSLYSPGGYSALGAHAHHLSPQAPLPEPNFVTTLTENDVLLGRGTPCAENEGNVRFRRLVKQRKVEYIAAEKRMRKDAIAREILEVIASRGGKFLRKVESQAELEQLGVPPGFQAKEVWAIVNEDTQVQKVKQALRNKDDAAELMASANKSPAETDDSNGKNKYGEHDVTNRFPRGVNDESNIHKADCILQFGTGVLERASSHSSNEEKTTTTGSTPKLKAKGSMEKGSKSPGSLKAHSSAKLMGTGGGRFDGLNNAGLVAARRASGMAAADLSTPTNRRNLLAGNMAGLAPPGMGGPPTGAAGLSNMMRRQLWDKSQAAPTDTDLRTIQELQRIRMMREQAAMGAAANPMMNPAGLGLDGAAFMADQQLMMNRQIQQQAQMQQQMAAAARAEQAAMAASLQASRSSFSAGGMGPSVHPSAALAARQLQLEAAQQSSSLSPQQQQRSSLIVPSSELLHATEAPLPPSAAAPAPTTTRPRPGADSAGERAIGIAQAMKRAEAFSPAESLEMSHLETLVLSVLCSHGLPVWTPEAHTKSFVTLPTFAKRLDWTWYGFASVLKQKASTSHHNTKKTNGGDSNRIEELTLESTIEYQRDPRELATKTIMLVEKLRRHCDTSSSSSQRKHSALGMRVPLWLDRELSRWAMTLDIADPTGRPVPFSSTDFVGEHNEYKEDPAVVATAAFDPPLADDVVDQIALLTRLRSVFVKTKGRELCSKLEGAALKVGEHWKDQPKGWEGEPQGIRDLLLCDRLLSEGFSGVLACANDLGTEYQLGGNGNSPKRCPSFEAVGLAKSSIQQRANQITRELHVMEEQKDLKRLRLDRMERLAQLVLSSTTPAEAESSSSGPPKKRKGSIGGSSAGSRSGSPVDPSGASSSKKRRSSTR